MFLALLPCCHLAKNSNCKSYSYPFTINITFALITINLIIPASFMVYVYVQSSNPAPPPPPRYFSFSLHQNDDGRFNVPKFFVYLYNRTIWGMALSPSSKKKEKKKSSSNCMFALRTNLLHAQAFTWLNCKCLTVRPSVDLSSIFLSTYSWTLRLP